MRRLILADLNNEFAQVGFDNIKSRRLHHVSQVDLLAHHGFALDDTLGVMVLGNVEDDLPGILRVGGIMNMAAVLLDVCVKLFEVVIEIVGEDAA